MLPFPPPASPPYPCRFPANTQPSGPLACTYRPCSYPAAAASTPSFPLFLCVRLSLSLSLCRAGCTLSLSGNPSLSHPLLYRAARAGFPLTPNPQDRWRVPIDPAATQQQQQQRVLYVDLYQLYEEAVAAGGLHVQTTPLSLWQHMAARGVGGLPPHAVTGEQLGGVSGCFVASAVAVAVAVTRGVSVGVPTVCVCVCVRGGGVKGM